MTPAESGIFGAIVIWLLFAVCRQAWEYDCMNPRRLFNWLIVLTVAAGLLSVPFAAPAVAKSHHTVSGGATHAMDGETHAMPDGMPCCPDEGKPAKDCDSCPLMALCSMTIPVPAPSGVAVFAPGMTGQTAYAFPDDLLIDGLGARPPDHPPRTMI